MKVFANWINNLLRYIGRIAYRVTAEERGGWFIENEIRCVIHTYNISHTLYLNSFRHSYPQTLVDLQRQHWDPLINWIQSHYSVRINTTEGIFRQLHPSETRERLSNIVSKFDSLKLSAFERTTMLSKSFIIGLGLVERRLSVEEAVQAAQVEVNAQIMAWGEVEDGEYRMQNDLQSVG